MNRRFMNPGSISSPMWHMNSLPPLTLIYTPAQHLLEQDGVDGSTKKYLQIIKNNAERMQKLISELMEFRKN